ncbi:MAG TPA: hypothetical protein VEK11_22745 [Thermoanaerobaculia bacterium]|nr:hypothetical protein [Thermoanaerobaculia bacterium]
MRHLFAVLILAAVPLFAQSEVGKVSFANSGAPQAQEAFARGLALLHNFEYSDAFDAFREAQRLDPDFAMAYWGEAMTHNHPIWFRQDAAAARAVLARLDRKGKMTERERDYLATLDVLYAEGPKNDRDLKYAEAMRALHEKYPDDVDARAFYALALLGTAHEGRDFATYMRAASLLEEVFPANQRHPGVLHYLIHSYDDPVHAPLGMRAAKLYGAVAPNAAHALHMTSHIFVAMAMWDDVIDANRRAIDVVNRQRAARGRPAQDCGHYPTWLHYGYLQKNRTDDARKALDACRAFASRAKEKNFFDEYAEMRAHHVATGYGLTEAAEIPEEFVEARYALAYADALGGADAEGAVARLRALQPAVLALAAKETNPSKRIRAEVMLQQAEALLLIAQGKRNEALPILEAAAKAERGMPLEFGPPVIPKPAGEMYAEQLLAAGRAADAVAAYDDVFARTPGRTVAVDGYARARKAAGERVAEEKPARAVHEH